MAKNKNRFNEQAREVNVSTKVSADKTKTKVNGGVFIYTGAISTGELAKTLNIPVGEIINPSVKLIALEGSIIALDTSAYAQAPSKKVSGSRLVEASLTK